MIAVLGSVGRAGAAAVVGQCRMQPGQSRAPMTLNVCMQEGQDGADKSAAGHSPLRGFLDRSATLPLSLHGQQDLQATTVMFPSLLRPLECLTAAQACITARHAAEAWPHDQPHQFRGSPESPEVLTQACASLLSSALTSNQCLQGWQGTSPRPQP